MYEDTNRLDLTTMGDVLQELREIRKVLAVGMFPIAYNAYLQTAVSIANVGEQERDKILTGLSKMVNLLEHMSDEFQ